MLFETGLRSYAADKDLLEKERKWTTVPFKDRHVFPEFLHEYKQEGTLRKQMNESGKALKLTYSGMHLCVLHPLFLLCRLRRRLELPVLLDEVQAAQPVGHTAPVPARRQDVGGAVGGGPARTETDKARSRQRQGEVAR